jgi:hypothetical protein
MERVGCVLASEGPRCDIDDSRRLPSSTPRTSGRRDAAYRRVERLVPTPRTSPSASRESHIPINQNIDPPSSSRTSPLHSPRLLTDSATNRFGPSIRVEPYVEEFFVDPKSAVKKLTREIELAMTKVIINAPDWYVPPYWRLRVSADLTAC